MTRRQLMVLTRWCRRVRGAHAGSHLQQHSNLAKKQYIMPDYRPYVKATTRKALNKFVSARLYRVNRPPVLVPVHVRCASSDPQDARFPFVEAVMGHSLLQPRIHDIYVFVFYLGNNGRRTRARFRLFCKRHARLPKDLRHDVKGDLVIMRVASHGLSSVVNLRPSDARLTDHIVQSVAEDLRAFQGPQRRALRSKVLMMDI
ncbi:hypothetical protein DFH06DRAFT_1126058 [Mycena polygramma]|nr:hypothetical protein DFH06DRAFT_1126058 [Mycena polygramma]